MLSTKLENQFSVLRAVSLTLIVLVLSSALSRANDVAPAVGAELPALNLAVSPSAALLVTHHPSSSPSKAPLKATTIITVDPNKTETPIPKLVPVALHDRTHIATNLTPASNASAAVAAIESAQKAVTPGILIITKQQLTEDHANETTHKFCDFLKPICESVDKIQPKQLFQIQTQFKQIVQSSAGKLGICFLEHYLIDPNLRPITKIELDTICSSRDLAAEVKGSYKGFKACAAKNWDQSVDKELDKIEVARQEFMRSHKHAKNDSNVPTLIHEDDDFSLISEFIGQVLDTKSLATIANRSDVKLFDISNPASTTAKPALVAHSNAVAILSPAKPTVASNIIKHSSTSASPGNNIIKHSSTSASPENGIKEMMNDPNTVLVLVDDSNTTTLPPILVKKDDSMAAMTTILLGTSAKPEVKVIAAGTKTSSGLTTALLAAKSNDRNTSIIDKLLNDSIPSSSKPLIVLSSSVKPTILAQTNVSISISGSASTSKPSLTTSAPAIVEIKKALTGSTILPTTVAAKASLKIKLQESINSTTIRPLRTLERVLAKQEKEKQDLEIKLRLERERVLRDLLRRQDEIDAQNAIRALQAQRQAQAHADTRLHQVEHERQMQIDPIGHTIKHQQYEINKQQRMMQAGRK